MELTLYEDQTGQSLFPDTKEKNERIVMFFNKGIDLYIEKKGDNIEIFCHVLAKRGSERNQGYYIRYKENYNRDYFTPFKKYAQEVLIKLKLQVISDDIGNTVFENIEKFDNDETHKNIDIIVSALKEDVLVYKDGNINEISKFCNETLGNIKDIKISISSEDSKLGNINISRNRYEEHLSPTENTVQILERHKKRLEQKRKDDIKRSAKEKIKEGIDTLKNIGYGIDDIKKELFPTDYVKKDENGDKRKIVIILGTGTKLLLSIFIVLLLINLLNPPFVVPIKDKINCYIFSDCYNNIFGIDNSANNADHDIDKTASPIPTTTSTVTPSPTATTGVTLTPSPTATTASHNSETK